MIGAIAEPCVKIIIPPKITRTIKIGINQYFFLANKNFKNSLKNDIANFFQIYRS